MQILSNPNPLDQPSEAPYSKLFSPGLYKRPIHVNGIDSAPFTNPASSLDRIVY